VTFFYFFSVGINTTMKQPQSRHRQVHPHIGSMKAVEKISISERFADFSCMEYPFNYNGVCNRDEVMAVIRVLYTIGIASLMSAGLILTLWIRDGQEATFPVGPMLTAVEQFRQSEGGNRPDDHQQTSPLVQEAQSLALYLNPPTVPSPPAKDQVLQAASKPGGAAVAAAEPRPQTTSPKFELHGISYYRTDPNQSMALICEPGGGRRWVRQGDLLGHIIIERIDSDGLVCRDGTQIQNVALASSEAILRFAQKVDERPRLPKQSDSPNQGTPAPPAVRGMRQMPLTRVAAKLGRA
jgi:hypothetical protein